MLHTISVTDCESDIHSMSSSRSSEDREAANLLNQMDNEGYERDHRGVVEMGDVTPAMNGNGITGCTDKCLALHQQHLKMLQDMKKLAEPRMPESPWHPIKTLFLVIILVVLVLWIIAFTTLGHLGLL